MSPIPQLLARYASLAINTTDPTTAPATGVPVICAWPVSGQYGIGSRILYYVLVAACVFARKAAWVRNACLVAALLVPAVAAIHGIVLAAMHIPAAVDMDVYGAFQLCAIGILAAPVTVRHSRTYFYDPGRNTIFLWTSLVLAGLLSLTVEFYRLKPVTCALDGAGNPIPSNTSPGDFFALNATCNLVCDPDKGPFSPLRGGSANNIYIIPEPTMLTFSAGTLLAAACCIPAILSMAIMWNRILEINWHTRFAEPDADERFEGTNGATVGKMRGINALVGAFLSTIEVPLFVAGILAILIVGERNFFSPQVSYMNEPMASIGQWAPVVGTALAICGSLLHFLVKDRNEEDGGVDNKKTDGNNMHGNGASPRSSASAGLNVVAKAQSQTSAQSQEHSSSSGSGSNLARKSTAGTSATSDLGNRRKVARILTRVSDYIGTAAPGHFDDSEFRRGPADDFPVIPAEELRNPELSIILESYNPTRDADGNATPLRRVGSRASSQINMSIDGDNHSDAGNDDDDHDRDGPSSLIASGNKPISASSRRLTVPSQVYHRPRSPSRPRQSSVPAMTAAAVDFSSAAGSSGSRRSNEQPPEIAIEDAESPTISSPTVVFLREER